MRPELPQFPKNTEAKGEIDILHTNSWVGNRRTGGHWGGRSPR
jgi:DNA helicase-2/ATP-dependent DNA helicase PcrA